ncbi:GroES-like protein [Gymnopus androsaceus JB14]|uniref:GroES-like protein n=1 Tax=Gymnopus androsaceus JB14 TaxID=1447944 RepID=A0A6A4H9V3_9AGAR|nr:GroES-like protein [Gymnopus androsaceus JB14]
MQALVTAPGNTAIVAQVPIPEPSSNEIRIKVHSVALNPVDALYVFHPADASGRVIGSDIAGVVDQVGSEVTRWKVGDRVAGLLQGATSGNARPGGFAEYAIVEADLVIAIPSQVSFDEAATFPLCSLTAAQALFIRLELTPPFPSPYEFAPESLEAPTILIYSAATSLGLFTIGLANLLRTPAGNSYRIFATASSKHHFKLLALGVEAWPQRVKDASGGIHYVVDCISEDESTALISQTFSNTGGRIAVIRKSAWRKEGIRQDVTPLYGAAWAGLGKEIFYNNEILPADPSWRALTVAFFDWMSSYSDHFPISPNPVRIMPGGFSGIADDAFMLLGAGKVADRDSNLALAARTEAWMKPISGEKLVYRVP